ncbi:segregation and condensation protein A [Candidatus Magnetomonas plexicatena]|uniref:segregation and condensation protein A n=1 Tax=Candidatus Magnetomonas plexicatena TaxID=2552947 RepID=UPI00110506D1|nr:segregation/condensation protein A [Nitrospirales bacterium LBB_01]
MEQELKVKLPVFEGPLDLLLSLIQKNKIDIYDIPIAFITRQYLEYLAAWTKELNVDVASEFLVMAATLIHIKSRMLLPVESQDALDEDEDPRLELVGRLLAYQSFKEAALALKEKETFGETYFFRDPQWVDEADAVNTEQTLFSVDLYVLLRAFSSLMDKKPIEARRITRESLTLKDKIAVIMERLDIEKEIIFYDLFGETDDRVDMIVSFLALLEILRLSLAYVFQEQYFGKIKIVKR